MITVWVLAGVVLCMAVQKFLWELDHWLDNIQGFAFMPESKAKELEQHLYGHG